MKTKKEIQADMRKNQILTIALDEFINKGYYGASTREISKNAGISSGLMFHYFANKDELYIALVEMGCSKFKFDMKIAKGNPYAYIKEIIDWILKELHHNEFFRKMFVFMDNAQNTKNIPLQARSLLKEMNLITEGIILIKIGQEQGSIREGNAHALLVSLGCAIQGIAQEKTRCPETPLPDIEWLMDIIKNRSKQYGTKK